MRMIEKALYAVLTGDAAIETIVGERIYNTVAPQNVTLPCVLFQKMGGFHIVDNPKEAIDAVYAIKALSDDLLEAEDLDFAIKEALDRQSITVNTDGMADYALFRGMNLHFLEDVGAGVVAFHIGALYDIRVSETQS